MLSQSLSILLLFTVFMSLWMGKPAPVISTHHHLCRCLDSGACQGPWVWSGSCGCLVWPRGSLQPADPVPSPDTTASWWLGLEWWVRWCNIIFKMLLFDYFGCCLVFRTQVNGSWTCRVKKTRKPLTCPDVLSLQLTVNCKTHRQHAPTLSRRHNSHKPHAQIKTVW